MECLSIGELLALDVEQMVRGRGGRRGGLMLRVRGRWMPVTERMLEKIGKGRRVIWVHEAELLFLCDKRFDAMMSFFCSAFLVSILGVSAKSWEKSYLSIDASLCLGDSSHICPPDVIRDLFVLENILHVTCEGCDHLLKKNLKKKLIKKRRRRQNRRGFLDGNVRNGKRSAVEVKTGQRHSRDRVT